MSSSRKDKFIITKLNLTHLELCRDLDRIALNELWSKENWKKELLDPEKICLGIIYHLELIAVCCGHSIFNEFNIHAIAVHPDYRKKGLGVLLLNKLIYDAKEKGCQLATLEVDEKNNAAKKLYEKFGFKTCGLRKNYFSNGNNALIKTLRL